MAALPHSADRDAGLARQFAACLARLFPNAGPELPALARRVCNALAQGHVCVQLSAAECARLPSTSTDSTPIIGAAGDYAPLIFEHGRLYLARYWWYETQVALHLRQRAVEHTADVIDRARLDADLAQLFAHNAQRADDDQQNAARTAVLRRFSVISGGPGTGKTSTVVRILAALQLQSGGHWRIGLAAPTGKAAARMQDAIRAAKSRLALSAEIAASVPEHAQTLHRLLGSRPDSTQFRHHAGRPLPLDVLVVDEASMIDLALMAKLLDALPPTCQLILLGDKDQLASVEAGHVFGDICAGAGQATGPLAASIALLRHSHRFADDSGVGALASACNRGDAAAVVRLLDGGLDGVSWRATGSSAELLAALQQGYADYFAAVESGAEANAAFAAFNRFRLLTAHREGVGGVQDLNRRFETALKAERGLHHRVQWYAGRAVMVTRNDYALKLFNGDIGLTLPDSNGELRVYFEDADGRTRALAPGRLPSHEPVFAMTVHKSQGSEFDQVLLRLPDQIGALLTRPLVYTAITRARHSVSIWGSAEVLAHAITQSPIRHSGLQRRLWEDKTLNAP